MSHLRVKPGDMDVVGAIHERMYYHTYCSPRVKFSGAPIYRRMAREYEITCFKCGEPLVKEKIENGCT